MNFPFFFSSTYIVSFCSQSNKNKSCIDRIKILFCFVTCALPICRGPSNMGGFHLVSDSDYYLADMIMLFQESLRFLLIFFHPWREARKLSKLFTWWVSDMSTWDVLLKRKRGRLLFLEWIGKLKRGMFVILNGSPGQLHKYFNLKWYLISKIKWFPWSPPVIIGPIRHPRAWRCFKILLCM